MEIIGWRFVKSTLNNSSLFFFGHRRDGLAMTWRSSTQSSEAAKPHIRTGINIVSVLTTITYSVLSRAGWYWLLCNQRTIRSQYVTAQKQISATNRAIHFLTWSGFVSELKLNTWGNAISKYKYVTPLARTEIWNICQILILEFYEYWEFQWVFLRANFHTGVDWSGRPDWYPHSYSHG